MEVAVHLLDGVIYHHWILDDSHQIVGIVIGIEGGCMVVAVAVIHGAVGTGELQQIESRLQSREGLVHVEGVRPCFSGIYLLWLGILSGHLAAYRRAHLSLPAVELVAESGVGDEPGHIRTSHVACIDGLLEPLAHALGLLLHE